MPTISPELLAQYQKLEQQVSYQKQANDQKEQQLKVLESRVQQGLVRNDSAQALKQNLERSMGNLMIPGNVGDINKVIWPFYFSIPFSKVEPGQNLRTQFAVTQEAAFSCMALIKAVYDFDDVTNEVTYIDPDEPAIGEAQGLSMNFSDAQSSRQFFNLPVGLDTIGNPRWPTALPQPYLFLPNSVVEYNIINNHPTNIYYVHITMFGYRVRVEAYQNILSTVYG